MIAISTADPTVTCQAQDQTIDQEDFHVGLLLTMAIVMFCYTLITLSLNYFVGIEKMLVITLGAKGNAQQVLNFWFLELSWHVVIGFLIFCGACDAAVNTAKKNEDVDNLVNDPTAGCNKSKYDVGGYVFAYSVAFIWCFTLNLWSIYVYYRATEAVYGLPCKGGKGKTSRQDSLDEP